MKFKEKVLIVDDEPLIRWTLMEALQEWGYATDEAANTTTAREKFNRLHPPIVLLDVNLPDGSGLELLRTIKAQQPLTTVIIMTGEMIVTNAVSALRGEADDFIGKPIQLDELRFALTKARQKRLAQSPVARLPRLLLIADSVRRAEQLAAAIGTDKAQATIAGTPTEWSVATRQEQDLIIVDVEPETVTAVLSQVRANPQHAQVTLLVENTRLAYAPNLTGALSRFRAMPCNQTEIVTLARRRIAAIAEQAIIQPDLAGLTKLL